MGEKITVRWGSDWCNVRASKRCLSHGGGSDKCWLLGDQVRICSECVRELYREDFSKEDEWVLEGTDHEGACATRTLELEHEEVVFCPGCVRKVFLEHDPRAMDWILSFHKKAGHTEAAESGLYDFEEPHLACRDCLLLVLYKIDPSFFGLVLTDHGKDLLRHLYVCKCECHDGGSWEGPWGCYKCDENHTYWRSSS